MRPEKDSTRQYKESKQQITISDEYRYENNQQNTGQPDPIALRKDHTL